MHSIGQGKGPAMVFSLQYLRAIAALLVVYFHAALQTGESALPRFGAAGVDIFFVLSGYMMWLTTAGRSISPAQFMQRRIVRIVPLYWLVTLFAAAVAFAMPGLARSTVIEGPHLLASLLFLPWPNPGAGAGGMELLTPVVIPGWTLNMEMFFYLLFALVLPLGRRLRIVAILLLLAGAFAIGSMTTSREAPMAFYGTSILFEFWFGILLAFALPRADAASPDRAGPPVAILLYLLWIVAFALLVFADWMVVRGMRMVSHGLPALCIVGIAIVAERRGIVPRLPWLEALGDASYSLYLTHGFVVAATRVLFAKVPFLSAVDHPLPFVAVAIAGSIMVGLLTYRWVEKPLILLGSRYFGRSKPPVIVSA